MIYVGIVIYGMLKQNYTISEMYGLTHRMIIEKV